MEPSQEAGEQFLERRPLAFLLFLWGDGLDDPLQMLAVEPLLFEDQGQATVCVLEAAFNASERCRTLTRISQFISIPYLLLHVSLSLCSSQA